MDKSIYVVDRTNSNISINNPFNLQSWVDKDWAEIDERKTIWLKFNKNYHNAPAKLCIQFQTLEIISKKKRLFFSLL